MISINSSFLLTLALPIFTLIFGFIGSLLVSSRKITTLQAEIMKEKQALIDEIQTLQIKEGRRETELSTLLKEHDELYYNLKEYKKSVILLEEQYKALNEKYHATLQESKMSLTKLEGQAAIIDDLTNRLDKSNDAHQILQDRYQALNARHTELTTRLEEKETAFKQQFELLEENKTAVKQEFENLAHKIFNEKSKTFNESNKESLTHLLTPFKEQIERFQKRINEVHDDSVKGRSNLHGEIKRVLDIGLKMSEEATNLTAALKGDSQQRGAWGEAQLERTLEMSGLVSDVHYEAQTTFKDAYGRNRRTDYLIKLPDGKHIIIDSKVSLVAYERAASSEDEESYQKAMAEHIRAVKAHIDDLASKEYTNLTGVESPSFILLFMPIEPAYIEALKASRDLFDYGYGKGIILVSHTTLIPILRTVSNLWMIEHSNREAREISEQAGEIFNQVARVAERFEKLGATLGTVRNHYNDTVTALVGQQGLYGKVDRFKTLSAKVSKTLPNVEKAYLDFDHDRLKSEDTTKTIPD